MDHTAPNHGLTPEEQQTERLLEHVRRISDSRTATGRMEKHTREILYAISDARNELPVDEWRPVLAVVIDYVAGESAMLLPDELEEEA